VPAATVAVFSASFGTGHDVAADELSRRLSRRGVEIRRFDFVDLMGRRFGPAARATYARQLTYVPSSWGRTLDLLARPDMVNRCAGLVTRLAGSRAAEAIRGADAVVSTYPLASLALGRLRRAGVLAAPLITFFTDVSVHPLWISPDADLHLAPHPLAVQQAIVAGAAPDRVAVAAPAVDVGRFRVPAGDAERERIRRHFGLPVGARLALISSGAWGVGAVAATARDVARSGQAIPVVACARNQALRHRLIRHGWGPALGWIDNMPDLIAACDVVVTNACGLTGLEAIACEVPVIAYRPLPGHGAANAVALHETGMGRYATDPESLAKYLAEPWPTAFSPYAVARPREIFDYPDPVDFVLDRLGMNRPALAGAA
jgi:UDP-N-acetylglucosamine:LPS N-acetylglucosamine transferase